MGIVGSAEDGCFDHISIPRWLGGVIALKEPAVTFMLCACLFAPVGSLCPVLEHHDEPVEQDHTPVLVIDHVVAVVSAPPLNVPFFGNTFDAADVAIRAHYTQRAAFVPQMTSLTAPPPVLTIEKK
ncbi:MAG TPA: hypothetical protein VJN96_03355 [Vicinamibacterales bacterium]|nr:hypothetical protein [Vicinamibacterales bacterium]